MCSAGRVQGQRFLANTGPGLRNSLVELDRLGTYGGISCPESTEPQDGRINPTLVSKTATPYRASYPAQTKSVRMAIGMKGMCIVHALPSQMRSCSWLGAASPVVLVFLRGQDNVETDRDAGRRGISWGAGGQARSSSEDEGDQSGVRLSTASSSPARRSGRVGALEELLGMFGWSSSTSASSTHRTSKNDMEEQ